jgi:hypothetical protein
MFCLSCGSGLFEFELKCPDCLSHGTQVSQDDSDDDGFETSEDSSDRDEEEPSSSDDGDSSYGSSDSGYSSYSPSSSSDIGPVVGAGIAVIILAALFGSMFMTKGPLLSSSQPTFTATTPAKQWTPAVAWTAPGDADEAMKSCKYRACFNAALSRYGAPPEAIEFVRTLLGVVSDNYLGMGFPSYGYPKSFRGNGRVKVVEVFYPGLGMGGSSTAFFVNGLNGPIAAGGDIEQAVSANPQVLQFKIRYPRVILWGTPAFVKESVSRDNAQFFEFSVVMLDGCHACALLGSLRIGFRFDSYSQYRGMSVIGIEEDKDAEFNSLVDRMASLSQYFDLDSIPNPDGVVVTVRAHSTVARPMIGSESRCRMAVNYNPNVVEGFFLLEYAFDVREVDIQELSSPNSNENVALSCKASEPCISREYSGGDVRERLDKLLFRVPPQNVDALIDDTEDLRRMCGQNSGRPQDHADNKPDDAQLLR